MRAGRGSSWLLPTAGVWLLVASGVPSSLAIAGEGVQRTLVIAGLGGEPTYERRFREQADAIAAAAASAADGDPQRVVTLTGERARREVVRRELRALAARTQADDVVTIVLLGHGSFDGEQYRYNVPGADLTGEELGELFDRLPAKRQLIVNATSASGATLELWQRPQRVVITATKSGGEHTATRFAQHWARALSGTAADTNKDGRITAAEAFEYAQREVAASFKSELALATEHARLAGEGASGHLVARNGPALEPQQAAASDPQLRALLAQRDGIEQALEKVKQNRVALSTEEYYDALEGVLVQLALLQRRIDARLPAGQPATGSR